MDCWVESRHVWALMAILILVELSLHMASRGSMAEMYGPKVMYCSHPLTDHQRLALVTALYLDPKRETLM